MRLPGFYHLKGHPCFVHIVEGCSEDEAATDGFGRYLIEELEEAHPCHFVLPSSEHSSARVDEPVGGWDNEADVRRAVWFLENEARPAVENNGGDRTTYEVACAMRDLGISNLLRGI